MDEGHTGEQLVADEPEHPTGDQVADWVTMYEKLITFTEAVLERTRVFMAELHGAPKAHVERTNVRIMEEELSVFRGRLDVWRRRAKDDQEAATGF